jgi:predicted regulator of Ras-like GTPase activity (Roadblock/LC7/MglB family)
MKDMILFPEDIDLLNDVLSQLAKKANLLLSVLINKDGRLLTSQGSLAGIDIVSMAALVAGNSASMLAIANIMGEQEFSSMYHQGKEKHIFVSTVDENTFLCLVFDDRTNIDRVKVFARQFDRQTKEALQQVYNKSEDDINLDLGFDQAESGSDQQQQPSEYMPQNTSDHFNSDYSANDNNSSPPSYQTSNPVGNNKATPELDTNYYYLQNKIKESVRKKPE